VPGLASHISGPGVRVFTRFEEPAVAYNCGLFLIAYSGYHRLVLAITASVLIPLLGITLPACLGLYYFIMERRRIRSNITNALRAEMARIERLLTHRLTWLDESGSRELPLVPFETTLYDAQVGNLGTCDADFASVVVSFYGIVHFLNAFQTTRADYVKVEAGGSERFFNTYKKTIRRAITRYGELPPGINSAA
jgi:hypothetical protein